MIAKSKGNGFTLIEILVVMSIGLLLMSVVMFSITTARQKSRDGKRIADISHLRLSLEQFYDACGGYPLKLSTSVNTGCTGSTNFGSFMPQIPTDPSTGAGYYYYATGNSTECYNYHIGATLENGSHAELSNDIDITTSPGAKCTPGGDSTGQNWVTGADPVYDFTPTR